MSLSVESSAQDRGSLRNCISHSLFHSVESRVDTQSRVREMANEACGVEKVYIDL